MGSPFLLQSQICCWGSSQNQGNPRLSPGTAGSSSLPTFSPPKVTVGAAEACNEAQHRLWDGCCFWDGPGEGAGGQPAGFTPVSDGSAGDVCHPPVPCAAGGLIAQHLPNLISCRNLPTEDLLLLFCRLNPPDSGKKALGSTVLGCCTVLN